MPILHIDSCCNLYTIFTDKNVLLVIRYTRSIHLISNTEISITNLARITYKKVITFKSRTNMSMPALNSPQTRSSHTELFNIDFNEHINFLQTSLINQLEILPKTNSSLQQIFHLLPIIFRFLRKNFQSQQELIHQYNNLSNSIQKIVSICSQYLHDRYEHENELLFLKDKISQILGQIGSTQYSLEQYRRMIHCLEQEIERLKILLHNPQLLQINQRKFQIIQEMQKIKLDRLIKENEKIQLLINQQTNAIEIQRTKIEFDLNELQKLKPIFERITLEQKDVDHHWLEIGLFSNNYN